MTDGWKTVAMPICVRFDLLYDLANRSVVQLLQIDMTQVPGDGQVVNIDGYPYRVVQVSWSVGSDGPNVYAYVVVQKASSFTVTLGGKEY